MAISRPYIASRRPTIATQRDSGRSECVGRSGYTAGIRLNCHANGDVAIDRVLTAYERALKLYPRSNVRPKITDCRIINDDLARP
jgi:hypothetical protein